MSFINRFAKFMYGRYGADDLHKFLLKLYIILIIVNLFLKSRILSFVEIVVIVYTFYRFLSKNCYQRRKENKKYLEIKENIVKPFKNIKLNIKDKDNVYKKCSKCKTILKLPVPSTRGIRHAKCPNCKKRLTIFTLKRQKVQVIKKRKH